LGHCDGCSLQHAGDEDRVGDERKTGLGKSRKWGPILTKPERIQRGWHRLGVFIVFLCSALYALGPGQSLSKFAVGMAVLAGVGYPLFWIIGWTIAGFHRGRDDR
jgi:hypothetical protein